ncbi:MAG: diguanylate cyclase [Sphingomonas sp.]|jgi:diguanylate cyclase (GGDEF)-like protein|nr:diguanylate cyclase [Sphingomonas sp.]
MSPALEEERLRALRTLEVLDTAPEAEFDAVVQGARYLFGCSMAFVSLLDVNRQWFKARCGFDGEETARDLSICQHTVAADETLVIPDTLNDPRFVANPFVTDPPHIRFYAGVPLRIRADPDRPPMPVGTLCVADDKPQHPSSERIALLEGMARVIEAVLVARRTSRTSLRLAVERQEALVEIERAQRLLQQAERMARIGSWRVDLKTGRSHWSAQTYAIHHLSPDVDTSSIEPLSFYAPGDRALLQEALAACRKHGQPWDLELDFVNADGVQRRVRTMGEPEWRDGAVVAMIGVVQDITERYKFERRLREFALTDDLTGLASRRAFNEQLDAAIATAAGTSSPLAVAIIDLDRFKEVNDRLGHPAGDEVLRVIASRLREVDYLGDCLPARLGGDEFVLLLRGTHARERLAEGIKTLLSELRHTVSADDRAITVSATIGACVLDSGHPDRSTLLQGADDALYRAKRLRRGTGAIAGQPAILTAPDSQTI